VDSDPTLTGAGTLTSTDANTDVINCKLSGYTPYIGSCPSGNTLQWISHNLTGYDEAANKAPSYTYTFDWTPPVNNVGTVTLYAAGTAGSGALVVNLTHTYLTKLQLAAAPIQLGDCVGMFSTATNLACSAMNQGTFQGNLAISIGAPTTYYGAMSLVGFVSFGDAAGMALYNAGGGGGASVSLDLYNTSANGGIPQAKIKAVDDGNYSDHLTFWTKTPGSGSNQVTEKLRITSTGSVGIGTSNPTLGPLQMGSGAYVSEGVCGSMPQIGI